MDKMDKISEKAAKLMEEGWKIWPGHATENASAIASLWSTYLSQEVSEYQAWKMITLAEGLFEVKGDPLYQYIHTLTVIWGIALSKKISMKDTCIMIMLVKASRVVKHRDLTDVLDMAVFANLAALHAEDESL